MDPFKKNFIARKISLIYISFVFIILPQESISCNLDVDSLFEARISLLENQMQDNVSITIESRGEDYLFLDVVYYLSKKRFVEYEQYRPFRVSKNQLDSLILWYENNKELISCEKVERAYYLLQNPPPFHADKNMDDVYELYDQQLDSLLIEPRKR
jgi:hypothetical protein